MNEDPRPPVAIRITRPYATEEELLQHEPETITRTGVTLLGAQQRPQGVVLRFELALSTGNAVLRGEGRVVAYKPNTQDGLGGLTLRFTRLDSRSKSLVDKAAALRDQRRQSLPAPPPSLAASMHPPPLPSPPSSFHSTPPLPPLAAPDARHSTVPPGPASPPPAVPPPLPPPAPVSEPTLPIDVAEASAPSLPPAPSSPALAAARVSSVPPPPPASAPRPAQPETQAQQLASPPGRDELLRRLRMRARALDASQVARILERK